MSSDQTVLGATEVLRRYSNGQRDFRGVEVEDESGIASFRDAVLDGADFSESYLLADFTNASLRGSKFVCANVKTCTFDGADLRGCDFSEAAIDGATFRSARLEDSIFTGAGAYGYRLKANERPDWPE